MSKPISCPVFRVLFFFFLSSFNQRYKCPSFFQCTRRWNRPTSDRSTRAARSARRWSAAAAASSVSFRSTQRSSRYSPSGSCFVCADARLKSLIARICRFSAGQDHRRASEGSCAWPGKPLLSQTRYQCPFRCLCFLAPTSIGLPFFSCSPSITHFPLCFCFYVAVQRSRLSGRLPRSATAVLSTLLTSLPSLRLQICIRNKASLCTCPASGCQVVPQ